MKELFYIGYYDIPENKKENRNIVLAATNKMTYIISAMEKCGYSVNLISAANTKNLQKYDSKIVKIGEKSTLFLPKSLPRGKNKLQRIRNVFYSKFCLFFNALKLIDKGDTVVVYHSAAYASVIKLIKKLRKITLILEVEEIYADVNGRKSDRKKEFALFKLADKYIFPTEMLNKKINTLNKPYAIIHGTYQVEKEIVPQNEYRKEMGWDEDKVHVVYAGTFDPRKGGIATAAAGAFLSSDYHIHVIGFGTERDKKKVIAELERVSSISGCSVSFDGLLSGEDYIKYIQGCDIGMSTQNPDAEFNNTSFPSKILSYMANGLKVVSIRIPTIEGSAISEYMYYYDEQTPEKIAEAIKSVNLKEATDSRKLISKLDDEFVKDIKKMLEGAV